MKKFLAILLSAVLCGTVAYTALAADEATDPAENDAVVVTETTVENVVDTLKNDEQAQEIADQIADAIKNGSTKEDVTDLLDALNDYVGNGGFNLDDLKDGGAVRDVVDMFLADAGIDSEELDKAISESTIANGVLDLYYSAPEETTKTTTPTPDPTEPEPTIPDTGYIG